MAMWAYSFAWGRNGHVYLDLAGHKITTPMREYLEALGRDGWELCGTLPERDGYLLILKRPTHE
jgi:hypothetical protein